MATGDLHIITALYVVTLSFCGKFGIYGIMSQTSYFSHAKLAWLYNDPSATAACIRFQTSNLSVELSIQCRKKKHRNRKPSLSTFKMFPSYLNAIAVYKLSSVRP